MSSTALLVLGVAELVIGGGLTLFSYFTRDAQTGQFVIWYKLIVSGAVFTVAGMVWQRMEDEPLI